MGKRIKQYQQNLNGLKTLEQNGKPIQRILIQVADEVIKCWKKQDMPVRARQTVITKLKRFYSYHMSQIFTFISGTLNFFSFFDFILCFINPCEI